jgi:hypothetical protein
VPAYIVYACPAGELAGQLDRYFAASRECCGPNTAHEYMPHCTLTGFFEDEPAALAGYVAALDAARRDALETARAPALAVRGLELRPQFHGLLLEGPWLVAMVADFARRAASPTRQGLRLKDWLHLSLAYGFPPEQHEPLASLARDLVDARAPVSWELRFYERHPDNTWTCHARWPLEAG